MHSFSSPPFFIFLFFFSVTHPKNEKPFRRTNLFFPKPKLCDATQQPNRKLKKLPAGAGATDHPELQEWMKKMGAQLKLKLDEGGSGGVSLSDYLAADANVGELTSPRSLHVCLKEGIDPATLTFNEEATFKTPGVPDDLVKMSFDHHESIRQDRLKSLVAQRDMVQPEKIVVPAFVPGGGKAKSTKVRVARKTLKL